LEKGIVKRFDDHRGYGFIEPNNGGNDLFVHHSNIIMSDSESYRTLIEGDLVSFEIEDTEKGLQAVQVKTL
jgi:CspA family cold shock protein